MTPRTRQKAQYITARARLVAEALLAPDPTVAMGQLQIRDLRRRLDAVERDLEERPEAGPDILRRLGRMGRAVNGLAATNTKVAMVLADTIETVIRLAAGHIPREEPNVEALVAPWYDEEDAEAIAHAVRVQGVANVVLHCFAETFPEYAVKLDRAALDRLITAWLAPVDGGKWAAVAEVCRSRLGLAVDPASVQSDSGKRKRTAYPR